MSSPWPVAFERGRARHAPLAWDAGAFERRARATLARRLAPLGLAADEAALGDLLARSAVEDLWLAAAVEACVPGAEARFKAEVGPALEALALKRGLVPARARLESARVLERVLAAPGATAGDRLGAYDGSADLCAWLAALIEEGEQARAAEPAPGEAPVAEPPERRPHPSALFLAAAAQGRLLVGEEHALAQHLPTCRRCLEHLKGLALAGLAPAEPVAPSPDPSLTRAGGLRAPAAPAPRRLGALLLSAGILLGVVALAMHGGGGSILSFMGRGDDTERGVHEAAQLLAHREPGFFAEFLPYDRGHLEGAPSRARGTDGQAVDLLHPLDDVLSPTPTLLWRPLEGVKAYHVSVRTEDGDALFERRTESHRLAWPEGVEPLARDARYVWQVRVEGPEELAAQARFRVASERQLQHWERRRTRIAALDADEAVRSVLLAQVALQRGHLWEAWQVIRAHEQRVPKDRYGGALADYMRRMHGYVD